MTVGAAGMDPLSDHFTFDALLSLAARHGPLPARDFLLDHDVLTRVTPELADRVLAHCQIGPERPMASLSLPELHRFHRALRDVLAWILEGHHGYGD